MKFNTISRFGRRRFPLPESEEGITQAEAECLLELGMGNDAPVIDQLNIQNHVHVFVDPCREGMIAADDEHVGIGERGEDFESPVEQQVVVKLPFNERQMVL